LLQVARPLVPSFSSGAYHPSQFLHAHTFCQVKSVCGSGAFLTGFRIGSFRGIPIPNLYFLELSDKFLGKKFYNSLKTVAKKKYDK
jgi:hypothetical protein